MAQRWIATSPTDLTLTSYDVPPPGPGEVTIAVVAAGVNPADHKHLARAASFPVPVGYEVAGTVTAVGAAAPFEVGDEVLAFRVTGGWASALTVPAADVFAKPASLSFPEAANLLLAGTTASEMLHVVGASPGETVLVHGASGAVGVAVLQIARSLGVHVIGTCSPSSFPRVSLLGGTPVAYGDGLLSRLPASVDAALDCIGTAEAVSASLALAPPGRIVTIAAPESSGLPRIAGALPASKAYRDSVRSSLVSMAASGELVVPMARTFPLASAPEAVALLRSGHPGGKLALLP